MGPVIVRPNLAASLIALLACASAAAAQPAPPAVEVRFAPGLGGLGGVFGDDDPESSATLGLSVGVQVRRGPANRLGLSFEAAFEPTGLGNPHFDETLRTVYALVGPEIGSRLYVRPAGGLAMQFWSGAFAASGMSAAIAAGVAVGYRRGSAPFRAGVEAVARASGSPGAASWFFGVQVPMSWGR
jgi:hypothetical protein